MASNGIGDLGQYDFMNKGMYPGSQIDRSYYATPTQVPLGAQAAMADYDPAVNPLTGQPVSRFARGGIATLNYQDGGEIDPIARMEEMNRPEAWNPESGQVKLQTLDPEDPYGGMKSVDYTIPQDQIKNFAPTLDPETGKPTGGGAYAFNDGSTMHIGRDGIVQAATPARNEYTLNKDGYYQPTGAGLTWDGGSNTLTKKIGGVDVLVPNIFHKGAYQDQKGNLRVDENGVPVPVAPNYADSGAGASWVMEYGPYMTAALLSAGAGMAAMGGMTAAEAAAAGGITALDAGATAVPLAEITGSTFAGPAFALPEAATAATTVGSSAGAIDSAAGISSADLGTTPYIANQGAPVYDFSAAYNGPLNYAKEGAKTLTTGQKLMAGSLAMKALGSGSGGGEGGGGGPSSTTTTTSAPQRQSPQQQPLVMSPYMTPMNTSGTAYNPMIYSYNTRRAAQGGMMYERGGGISTLGSYSDGGRLLKGPGDGMSDGIPARIGQKQPAALADGEFVVPADVVSHLGNGSTDAGAKQLYKMMDQIRQARTGRKSQGKKINPNKFLPKE
jgi:hypothetical protein